MSKYLVTGGCGFMLLHFCQMTIGEKWAEKLLNIDALTYAGNPKNLEAISKNPNYQFLKADVAKDPLTQAVEDFAPDVIVHFAAESHVDRSIQDPSTFLKTNILGTYELLECVRKSSSAWAKNVRFVYISTDEVYGALGPTGYFTESTPLQPRSPYSSSKASADMLTQAYFHTYKLNTVVVRCSNNYGPHQFPEKLIPQTILFALQNKSVPVYGTGENVRDWIFVTDFAKGIQAAITRGQAGEVYNFGGRAERRNIDLVRNTLKSLGKPDSLIQFVEDRKGHDFRYAVNFEKSERELGWSPAVSFETGLAQTIAWYQSHQDWWNTKS